MASLLPLLKVRVREMDMAAPSHHVIYAYIHGNVSPCKQAIASSHHYAGSRFRQFLAKAALIELGDRWPLQL
ncbi:MAG TPA: hypothetical protein PKY73_17485, partial [Hyphomonas sp.]|nr:hypothetical protein [Hyphomonas sp.]